VPNFASFDGVELFYDDQGDGRPVVLLHGFAADTNINFVRSGILDALVDEGYRTIALDHRGHGRGMRSTDPFSLRDCAADAAGVLRELGATPAIAVGYSMGGPIAQLMARDHRDVVSGLVCCATAQDWQDLYMKGVWWTVSFLRLWMGVFPTRLWKWLVKVWGVPAGPQRDWMAAELSRGSTVDLVEAGRELSRYDAVIWMESAAALGARHIKVGDFFKTSVPMPKLVEEFVKLCQEAREHGTRIVFEFMPFSRIETLADAIALCTGAAQPNGGICIDLWHVVKLGMPYAAVAAFPRPYLMSIEINDGYLQAPAGLDMVTETTCHRAFCGEGEFDVRGFVDALRPVYAGPWGIEVLNKAQRAWPLDELTTRAFATTRAVFRD